MVVVGLAIWFRNTIADLVGGVVDYTIGGLMAIWPTIRTTVLIAIGVAMVGWIALLIFMVSIGAYANSIVSALAVSFLFPIWFVAFVMPPFANRIWFLGPFVRISRMICSPILLLALVHLAFGLWSPESKAGFDRWSSDKKASVGFFFHKRATQTEKESGILGTLNEEKVVLYNETAQVVVHNIPKGTRVKIADLKGEPAAERFEGMTKVMLPNQHGDFVGGLEGYVPSRKIDWKKA